MACYSPNNQYYIPRPHLVFSCLDKGTKNFLYGAAYGGIISMLYCNPLPRTIKMTLGWGLAFELAFTRGLYNSPGYLKRTDFFKPDFDRDSDWVNAAQIEKWYPRKELLDWTPSNCHNVQGN
mmetsp:Transcript_73274/g.116797  ORF Transcript_73274/g.116797 Transcript_73274/m.116797 type:complete len:122 (+) Transcript_73274:65-430(+)